MAYSMGSRMDALRPFCFDADPDNSRYLPGHLVQSDTCQYAGACEIFAYTRGKISFHFYIHCPPSLPNPSSFLLFIFNPLSNSMRVVHTKSHVNVTSNCRTYLSPCESFPDFLFKPTSDRRHSTSGVVATL